MYLLRNSPEIRRSYYVVSVFCKFSVIISILSHKFYLQNKQKKWYKNACISITDKTLDHWPRTLNTYKTAYFLNFCKLLIGSNLDIKMNSHTLVTCVNLQTCEILYVLFRLPFNTWKKDMYVSKSTILWFLICNDKKESWFLPLWYGGDITFYHNLIDPWFVLKMFQ